MLAAMQLHLSKLLVRRVPILSWLPQYSLQYAAADLVAGITVGLTLMPQAIAYASLAGLQSQYGLHSAFASSLVYVVLGTCRDVNIGPTALVSLLTSTYIHGTHSDMAVLLCFLSGCVELLCGIFHLGFMVEFVSIPMVAGFTSAAALIIACSQIKGLLGLSYNAEGKCPVGLEYILVTPSAGLLFPAVDFVRDTVARASEAQESGSECLPVVVDCRHLHRTDFTEAQGVQALIQDFTRKERHVIFHYLKPEVARIIQGVCPSQFVFSTTEEGLAQILKDLQTGMRTDRSKQEQTDMRSTTLEQDTHF